MWQSDDPVTDAIGLWEYCDRSAAATGVWPVLSGRFPYHPITPQRLPYPVRVGDFDLEAELEGLWHALRARQAEGPHLGGYPDDFGDAAEFMAAEAEAWRHRWPPYEEWPGLAPAAPDSGVDAAQAHRFVLQQLVLPFPPAAEPMRPWGPRLALVRAERPADIPAVMAWDAEAPHQLLSAMLRSWEDRFGARVVAFEGAKLHVSVTKPPLTEAQASHVAFEHVLLGDDNNKGVHFADYARSLVGHRYWLFWWD